MGLWASGSGFRVYGLRDQGLGFMGFGFRVLGFRDQGLWA